MPSKEVAGDQLSKPEHKKSKENAWSLEYALKQIGFGNHQRLLTVVVGGSMACDSMEVMVVSVLQGELGRAWQLQGYQVAAISAAVFLGELIGSALFGAWADRRGRRVPCLAALLVVAVFGFASGWSQTWQQMAVLRGIVGIGVGGFTVPWDLLVESVPDRDMEGMLVIVNYFWTAGAILTAVLSWAVLPSLGWRWLLMLCAIPSALIFPTLLLKLPESPRFLLYAKGDTEAAEKFVRTAAKMNRKSLPSFSLVTEAEEAEEAFLSPQGEKLQSPLSRGLRRLTFTVWIIWFSFGWCYYGVVLLVSDLFSTPSNGSKPNHANVSTQGTSFYLSVLLASVGELVGVVLAQVSLQIFAARHIKLQWTTMAVCAVSFALLALPPSVMPTAGALLLAMTARSMISTSSFATWLYTSAVYPTRLRARGHSYASAMARIAAIFTPFCANILFLNSPSLPSPHSPHSPASPAAASFLQLNPVMSAGEVLAVAPSAHSFMPLRLPSSGSMHLHSHSHSKGKHDRSNGRSVLDYSLPFSPLTTAAAGASAARVSAAVLQPFVEPPRFRLQGGRRRDGEDTDDSDEAGEGGEVEMQAQDERGQVGAEAEARGGEQAEAGSGEAQAATSSQSVGLEQSLGQRLQGLGHPHSNVRSSPMLAPVMLVYAAVALVGALAAASLQIETKAPPAPLSEL